MSNKIDATTEDWPPKKSKQNDTALVVNDGVNSQPTVNPYIKNFFVKKKPSVLTAKEYLKGIFAGDRAILFIRTPHAKNVMKFFEGNK